MVSEIMAADRKQRFKGGGLKKKRAAKGKKKENADSERRLAVLFAFPAVVEIFHNRSGEMRVNRATERKGRTR